MRWKRGIIVDCWLFYLSPTLSISWRGGVYVCWNPQCFKITLTTACTSQFPGTRNKISSSHDYMSVCIQNFSSIAHTPSPKCHEENAKTKQKHSLPAKRGGLGRGPHSIHHLRHLPSRDHMRRTSDRRGESIIFFQSS